MKGSCRMPLRRARDVGCMMYICTSIRYYSISKSVITYVPGTIQVDNLFDSMLYICMVWYIEVGT